MSPPSCQTCGRTLTAAGPCPTCLFGLSADDARDTFAGLKLEDELGRGGMGTVFRATQVTLGRSVAVKFLAPELGQTSEGRARFEREAKALALLDHPHIVRVHDFGIEDGESYLVMELVEGGDVTKRVPMTVGEAVACARQVCDALGYAHERGVIHRDIKPQNLLLDERGQAKVTDFGIARVTRGDGQAWPVTAPDVRVGSVGFMAPEMMSGGPVTPRLDVYSVGALVRALVTGRAPVGETHELPERLEAVVRRAMAERPEDRFATMADLSAALALAVAPTGPTLGAQPRAPQGFTPLPEDERLWLHAVAFVQTLAVAAVLWAGLLSLSPRTQQPSDLTPLTSFSRQVVDGEHVMTRARFETGAVLLAVVALALAFAATGWLKRHWRLEGLDSPAPEQPLPYTRHVWWLGVIAAISYGLRVWLAPSAASVPWLVFLPFFGGVMELAVLYFTVWSVLEGSRRRRPLTREPWLWAGQLLALIPPVTEFVRSV